MRNPQEIEQLHQTVEVVAAHLHHIFSGQVFVHILPVVLFRPFPFGTDKQEIHIGMVAQGLAHRLGTLDARTARPTKHSPKIYQDIFAPVLLREAAQQFPAFRIGQGVSKRVAATCLFEQPPSLNTQHLTVHICQAVLVNAVVHGLCFTIIASQIGRQGTQHHQTSE